jgi:hypothetical protein
VFGCLVWVGQTGFVDVTPSSLYKGHRYPVEIISHGVWLYHRFPLSLREIEELMLARGVLVTYETVRAWCRKFGQAFANEGVHLARWRAAVPVRIQRDITALPAPPPPARADAYRREMTSRFATWNDVIGLSTAS